MFSRKQQITARHARLRKIVAGTLRRPRLAVHFSGQHIYAQVIDDDQGRTLVSANTTEKSLRDGSGSNVATAMKVGKIIAERAKEKNISNVVFDRGGFCYHGKVKALADAVRDGGVSF